MWPKARIKRLEDEMSLHVLNAFPTLIYVFYLSKHASSNLYFVNLELEMSPVTMYDWKLLSTFNWFKIIKTCANPPKCRANLNPKYYIGIQFHCIMINVCDIECLNYITNFHDTKALTLTQASNFKIHCSGLVHSLTTFTL